MLSDPASAALGCGRRNYELQGAPFGSDVVANPLARHGQQREVTRTVSPFISERPTLFCRYGIMFLMIVAHGTDVSGSYGGHTEAVEATQRL